MRGVSQAISLGRGGSHVSIIPPQSLDIERLPHVSPIELEVTEFLPGRDGEVCIFVNNVVQGCIIRNDVKGLLVIERKDCSNNTQEGQLQVSIRAELRSFFYGDLIAASTELHLAIPAGTCLLPAQDSSAMLAAAKEALEGPALVVQVDACALASQA
ncbi:unnamed protein product [Chrysoparadoxa australica]